MTVVEKYADGYKPIAIVRDEDADEALFYNHFNYDEHFGVGDPITGPFSTLEDARQDLIAHYPAAREIGRTDVVVRAAASSCIKGRDVFIIEGQGTFLGEYGSYRGNGIYNNEDYSLRFVSDNETMFRFLEQGEGWTVSQQKMIDDGNFTLADYEEYAWVLNFLPSFLDVKIPVKKFCLSVGDEEYDIAVPFTTDRTEMLVSKMEEEQRDFVKYLIKATPLEILHRSFEYATRQDIIYAIKEEDILSEEDAETLLPIKGVLGYLYSQYVDNLSSYMETLGDTITGTAHRIREKAVSSMEANLTSLIEIYEGSQSPKDTVNEFVEKVGYDEARETIAALVRYRADQGDGRISTGNASWASDFERYDYTFMKRKSLLDKIHPAHINQLGLAIRGATRPTQEQGVSAPEQESKENAPVQTL